MANSIKKETASALGIPPALIPERLRNRLNTYLDNGTVPKSMIEKPGKNTESHHYQPKPIQEGNQIYLRNIVYLDTLFDDPKIVSRLILNALPPEKRQDQLDALFKVNSAKLDLLKSILPMQQAIADFLKRDCINWNADQLPYPYSEGSQASPLISTYLDQDSTPSIYDQALKAYLNKDFRKAYDLIQMHPNQFTSNETFPIKEVIMQKYTEFQEYADYLANFD